jgi:hypothetical protein
MLVPASALASARRWNTYLVCTVALLIIALFFALSIDHDDGFHGNVTSTKAASRGVTPGGYEQPPAKEHVWFTVAGGGGFKQRPLVTGDLKRREGAHSKWVVVTTINPPTPTIKRLAALPGWRVVVLGDTKTPKDWAWPNVTYLSIEAQLGLGFSTTPLLCTRCYTRKNVGYIYAVLHGARVIYETDDDNELTKPDVVTLPTTADGSGSARMLEYTSRALTINHHAHFGQPSTWPRGYPLEAIAEPHATEVREVTVTPAVQQGLADGDPDMDAIFRLTRKPSDRRIDFSFAQAPPIALPFGSFAPYNAQNTVFNYEALWATVLPQSVEFRVCDIWRAFFTERLLWGVGAQLAFVAPYVYQMRNAHNYHGDYISEAQIFDQATTLLEWLRGWRCPASAAPSGRTKSRLPACATALARGMAEAGFWGPSDAELVRHFYYDLERAGYDFPQWLEDGSGYGKRACEAANECGADGPVVKEEVVSRPSIELYGTCSARIDAPVTWGRLLRSLL